MQPFSPPRKTAGWLSKARVWDILALLVIAFVLWRLLIAPRSMPLERSRPAPRLVLSTLSGKSFALEQHRGRVVFLDFYATWCTPCKLSLPLVERFAQSHPDVDVIPIDVGEKPHVAAQFAREMKLGRVALDRDQVAAEWFGVVGFPTMVVIDPHSRVRATWAGLNPAISLNMAGAASQLQRD